MITYLLIVLLCPAGVDQCYAREFATYATLESCAADAQAAGAVAVTEYVAAWQQATGEDPPPTQVTIGCREERST